MSASDVLWPLLYTAASFLNGYIVRGWLDRRYPKTS